MKTKFLSWFGWYGVIAILAAYALMSFKIIQSDGLLYQLLNLTGAIGIATEAASKKDKQPVVLNIVWAVIALVAIGQIIVNN